ncbi:MacB family efflux pump subunit [Pandoraea pulmonicola]|uniref:Pyoverdine export ATP-binding/permease protein PvdT n=1 Tax=Pandoraea pulmonicola TaxID=93221 RepID=A0AAJ5D237_PANPU|nr:MacB family efflux pump subunit [Pandoraea pulmonicola]AJC19705.1 macrolide ABC transporter permease/ATP-binding protein MacB [Pandoraea pulmonicola]SUA92165.1 Macrolide export ATP-binding/permease protein MacB [Pandoraea pulmonicola]
MTSAGEPLLRLTGISRTFGEGVGAVTVLRDVELVIRRGEMVAIMGPSGSGKSTLMNVLGCLDRPSTGRYEIDGQDVASLTDDALARLRREYFGFIFQRYHLMGHLTAQGNVEVPAVYAGTSKTSRATRSAALLERLGLGKHLSHRPAQMSGGQQQRVSIARALMNGGDIILADEPTGALDSRSGLEVMQILCELHARGHTIILVTHDPGVAAWAQRVIEIADGRVVRDRINETPRASPRAEQAVDASRTANDDDRHHEPADRAGEDDIVPAPASAPATPRQRWLAGWPTFSESLAMAWHALASHRLRTGLTMLGIVIGITSVVSLSAIGEGTKRRVIDDIGSIAPNTITVLRGKDFNDDKAAEIRTLLPRDVALLAAQPYTDSVSPQIGPRTIRMRFGRLDTDAQVHGEGADFLRANGLKLSRGRSFDANEVERQAQVALIGENALRKLMPHGGDPIGQIVLAGSLPLRIIGVIRDKSSMFVSRSLNVYVPWTTVASRLSGQQHLESITVRVLDGHPPAAAEAGIIRVLTRAHGQKDFFTFNMDTIVQSISRTSQMLTLLLSFVALISLVVGGIGVMNIMLVSVTERTREIGIRRAIGARRQDILRQFLIEAVLVCLMGGAVGVALSYAIGRLVAMFVPQIAVVFSVSTFVAAVMCASVIGMASGWWPARSAARLDPVDALARE